MKEDALGMKNRILYLDFLRVLSIFFVLLLHAAATQKSQMVPYSYNWVITNTAISISRWAVPVFLMISGYFFLNPKKEISIRLMYTKYIKRIVLAFLFWSFLYAVATTNSAIRALDPNAIGIILEKTIRGHAQYWYLLMLIGLYMITPILKVLINNADKKLVKYFLFLGLILSGIVPLFRNLSFCSIANDLFQGFEIYLVIGYSLYYVLGYYLGTYELKKQVRLLCYLLGILGAVITCFGYFISTRFLGASSDLFQDYLTFSNVFMSVAVFVGAKQLFLYRKIGMHLENVIHLIAKYSFGMYLTNDFFNMVFYKCNINILQFGVVRGILVFTILDFIGSFFLIFILHKLPIVRNVC